MLPRSKITDFEPVIFIRPTPTKHIENSQAQNISAEDKQTEASVLSGQDVKDFYQNLVETEASATESEAGTSVCKKKIKTKQDPAEKAIPTFSEVCGQKRKMVTPNLKSQTAGSSGTVSSRTLNALLKAAQEGNATTVSTLLRQGVPLDSVDLYGWTALMCAVRAENVDMVKYLLRLGADACARNNQGQSVWDVAEKCKDPQILSVLGIPDREDACEEKRKKTDQETFYCEVCKANVSDTSRMKHMTSTVHLFNRQGKPKGTIYSIPENNRGFQMMLRSGWNKEKGLGSEGQGQKFPIKTLLKRDRQGLGKGNAVKARVTHFGPNDEGAVKTAKPSAVRVMKASTQKKKNRIKELNKERRKERNFRMQFSME